LDEARVSYEEVLKRDPKSVAAETMLGTILMQQKKTADARKHFERAVEIDPHTAVASNDLAWDYANNGGNLDIAQTTVVDAKLLSHAHAPLRQARTVHAGVEVLQVEQLVEPADD